jgi:hypothetical protein
LDTLETKVDVLKKNIAENVGVEPEYITIWDAKKKQDVDKTKE